MATEIHSKHLDRDILPILIVTKEHPPKIISFEGTGFLLAPNLLITCWHCVRKQPPEGCFYATTRTDDGRILFLSNIQQDENKTDLATANLPILPDSALTLGEKDYYEGTDVYSFGYPLLSVERLPEGGTQLALDFRYLKGYITRSFWFDHSEYGRTTAYELDMPTPEGLSGGPLMRMGSREVIGVVFGSNEVAQITAFARVDPETGEREPEIQKVVYFGLSHTTETLKNLRTKATRNLPLSEYLKEDFSKRRTEYSFYVSAKLIFSAETIELPCGCGTIRQWHPPHSTSDLFCAWCGSRFRIEGVMEGVAVIRTAEEGDKKVIGAESGFVMPDEGQGLMIITDEVGEIIDTVGEDLALGSAQQNGPYLFFIRPNLIGSDKTIKLTCMCGTVLHWGPPHNEADLFCASCNARFIIDVVEGGGDYMQTGAGPIKIIGTDSDGVT